MLKRTILFVVVAGLVLALAPAVQAAPMDVVLQLDLGENGQDVQTDWDSLSGTAAAVTTVSGTYSGISVELTGFYNVGGASVKIGMRDTNDVTHAMGDVLEDFAKVDAPGTYLKLILGGLTADTQYSMTTYHHFSNAAATSPMDGITVDGTSVVGSFDFGFGSATPTGDTASQLWLGPPRSPRRRFGADRDTRAGNDEPVGARRTDGAPKASKEGVRRRPRRRHLPRMNPPEAE